MTKTPEELAKEWAITLSNDFDRLFPADPEQPFIKTFLAGYEAAAQQYEARIADLETELDNWKHAATYGDDGL